MSVNRKVYFLSDPGVTVEDQIVITSRDAGVTTITTAGEIVLEIRTEALPDAAAGRGTVYKVMAEEITSKGT